MITVIATLKIKAGHEAEFDTAAKEMVEYVSQHEAGTLSYVFLRASDDPCEVTVYETYSDPTALAAHSGSEQMKSFFTGGASPGRLVLPPSGDSSGATPFTFDGRPGPSVVAYTDRAW